MNSPTSSGNSHNQVNVLTQEARAAAASGDVGRATRLWERVLGIAPDHPEGLLSAGQAHLARGDTSGALALLSRAVEVAPDYSLAHAYLARVHQSVGDLSAALACIDRALDHEPTAWGARFEKAMLLESMQRGREAALAWSTALGHMPPEAVSLPQIKPVVARAQAAVEADHRELRGFLDAATTELRRQERPRDIERFEHCLDITTGRRSFVTARPLMVAVPGLPAIMFFHREDFDWAPEVEARTGVIREELQQVLRDNPERFTPYVQTASGQAKGQFEALDGSMDWGAYFLWKHGTRIDSNCNLCPQTEAAVLLAPQVHIRSRAPAVFFSVLQPGTHIPPHNGATNARLTVHLPLIVPDGCGFRVGDETREWNPGELLIFDDTIRHEAWNRGNSRRVVLIFDIWHPMLTSLERELLTRTIEGMVSYYEGAAELGEL